MRNSLFKYPKIADNICYVTKKTLEYLLGAASSFKYLLSNLPMKTIFRSGALWSRRARSFSTLLIKNGTVLNADLARPADVLIQDEKIVRVDPTCSLSARSAEILDAKGMYLIPGGIDAHTHMQMPFMGTKSVDDFNFGTRAAVAGGTTCLVDFVIPQKNENLVTAFERWRSWADPKVHCDYALHCAVPSWTSDTFSQMQELVSLGVTTFKAFMAYKGSLMLTDDSLFKFFEACRKLGALAMVHCENGELIDLAQRRVLEAGVTGPEGHYLSRPDIFEAEATHRAITIAEYVNAPLYIVHCMSKKACEEIARARARGVVVFGETLASALGTDGQKYWDPDWEVAANHVMSPPLNPDVTVKTHLMNMLEAGVLQTVSTDNCSFSTEQRMAGRTNFAKIPNGVHGIQDRMGIVWQMGVNEGRLGKSRFVEVTSANPARLMGLYPEKGVISEGADADLVLWNPEQERTVRASEHEHAIDYNIYEGRKIRGAVDRTISRGRIVYEDGKVLSRMGQGRYRRRLPFGYPFERLSMLMKREALANKKAKRVEKRVAIPYDDKVAISLS